MSERICDRCGRRFRRYAGSEYTRCVSCRRSPGVDLSPRPCRICGATFSPSWAPRPATACPPCRVISRKAKAAERRTRNPEAHREYQRRYKAANPDYQRDWAHRNPEKAAALQKRSSAAAAERDRADPQRAKAKRRESWRRYRAAVETGRLPERFRDPDKQRRDWMLRRARKYGVDFEVFDNIEIFDRDRWVCQLCHQPIDSALRWPDPGSVSLDHIVPLSRDGGHTRANSQAAHVGCNWRKYVNTSLPSD